MKKTLIILLLSQGLAAAALGPPRIAWNPNVEPDVTSYVLYIGTNAGSYLTNVTIGAPLTSIPSKLLPLFGGQTNFMVVTAVNSIGMESGPSNEIGVPVPKSPNALRLALESAPTPTGPWAETGDSLLAQMDTTTTRFYRARLIAGDN